MQWLVYLAALAVLGRNAQEGGAVLSVRVKDTLGVAVAGAAVELRLESVAGRGIEGKTDSSGSIQFSGLRAGKYSLRLFSPGFLTLRLRSIEVIKGERTSLPELVLAVQSGDCSDLWAQMEYARLTGIGDRVGTLVGRVSVPEGGKGNPRPAVGARVTPECPGGQVCGATTTDSKGEFRLHGLAAGEYSLILELAGYYREELHRFRVLAGMEAVYRDIRLQSCRRTDCGDITKSRRRQAICE